MRAWNLEIATLAAQVERVRDLGDRGIGPESGPISSGAHSTRIVADSAVTRSLYPILNPDKNQPSISGELGGSDMVHAEI